MSVKRLVVLGKTGAGKSSIINTIFGETLVKIYHCAKSGTSVCQAKNKSVNGRSITLIDTPGLFDTERPEEEMKPEIVRCITECAPGPHAFLIMLKVEKFTEQEQAVINKICQYFSEEALKHAVIVFTHGDQLPEGKKIEEFISENKNLSDLVKMCGGRCHVIDNKYWNNNQQDEYRSNRFQVEELLKTIDKTVTDNNESCYTNEMLQAVEKELRQEEEHIRQSLGNMSEEEIREKAKENVRKKLLTGCAGVGTGALIGGLLGATAFLAEVAAVIAVAATAVAAPVGAVIGGVLAYNVAKIGRTVEAGKRTAGTAVDKAKQLCEKASSEMKSQQKLKNF